MKASATTLQRFLPAQRKRVCVRTQCPGTRSCRGSTCAARAFCILVWTTQPQQQQYNHNHTHNHGIAHTYNHAHNYGIVHTHNHTRNHTHNHTHNHGIVHAHTTADHTPAHATADAASK